MDLRHAHGPVRHTVWCIASVAQDAFLAAEPPIVSSKPRESDVSDTRSGGYTRDCRLYPCPSVSPFARPFEEVTEADHPTRMAYSMPDELLSALPNRGV